MTIRQRALTMAIGAPAIVIIGVVMWRWKIAVPWPVAKVVIGGSAMLIIFLFAVEFWRRRH